MDDAHNDIEDWEFGQVEICVWGLRSEQQSTALETAVEKLAAAAAQLDLTIDDLIELLRSGMTVGDLLYYVVSQTRQRTQ